MATVALEVGLEGGGRGVEDDAGALFDSEGFALDARPFCDLLLLRRRGAFFGVVDDSVSNC